MVLGLRVRVGFTMSLTAIEASIGHICRGEHAQGGRSGRMTLFISAQYSERVKDTEVRVWLGLGTRTLGQDSGTDRYSDQRFETCSDMTLTKG